MMNVTMAQARVAVLISRGEGKETIEITNLDLEAIVVVCKALIFERERVALLEGNPA